MSIELSETNQKKQRTKILIQHIDRQLNPIKDQCHRRATKLFSPLQTDSAKYSWDKQFEKSFLSLQANLSSQSDIDDLKEKLSTLKFSKWQDILDGKNIDV